MVDPIIAETTGSTLHLRLNDPDTLNALTPAMIRLLVRHLEAAAVDPAVRVVILSGVGRAFSSGGNARAFGAKDPDDPLSERWGGDPLWNSLELRSERLIERARASVLLHTMPKPTIAMLRGAVAGASLGLAAACDFRIASQTTVFTTAFGKLGTSGDFGTSYFLTRLVGPTHARSLMFLSDKVDATTALGMGLASTVVEDGQLESETEIFAKRLEQSAPLALRYMKQNLLAAETMPMTDAIAIEARNMARTFQTADFEEGVAAFREKRAPWFQGR